MRFSAFWTACALSFAAHAVEDVDSSNTSIQSTTPSPIPFSTSSPSAPTVHDSRGIPNAHVLVVISTSIATSTITLDSNEKGDSTTCLTYTTLITHTYTRTRTTQTGDSSINTGTATGDSLLVTLSVTGVPNLTTSGVTIDPDGSDTEGADPIAASHTGTSDTGSFSTGVPTGTNADTSITNTYVASASDTSTAAAEITNPGSSNGSSTTDDGTTNTSVTGTSNNPGTGTVTGIATTETETDADTPTDPGATNPGAATGGDTSFQTSFTSSTPDPRTTTGLSHPSSTKPLTHSTAISSPTTTSDDSNGTSSKPPSTSTVSTPEGVTSTVEASQPSSSETLPTSSVISTATTDEDGTTQVVTAIPGLITTSTAAALVTTSIDEEGDPILVPIIIPTTTGQSMPNVISTTTTTTGADGNTMTAPLVISTTIIHTVSDEITTTEESGGIVPVPGLITTTDGSGGIITVSNGVTLTGTGTAPHGIVTATTDLDGGIVTIPQGVAMTTTDANGIVGTVYPGATTTDGPIAIAPLPGYLITSSMSCISSEFRKLLPLFTSWGKDPSPPLQTHIINGTNGIKGIDGINIDIKDLFPKLGKGSAPGCSPDRKRGLFDGLLDLAGDGIDTIANALSCITDNLKRLKTELERKNSKGAKGILDKLISPDPSPNTPDDNPPDDDPSSSTSSTSTSSSSSSSTCTSDKTAYQVTVLCQPTLITLDGSIFSTTTCSPTTTITTSGCSVADTTTTITETPTSTPNRDKGCAADSCGEMCSAGGISGGWITLGPINCARLSTRTVAALPTASQGAISFASNRTRKEFILVKRVDDPPAEDPLAGPPTEKPLPDLEPGSDLLNEYLTDISRHMARETQWLLYMRVDVRGKWYPFTEQKTAAGVGPLYGCTSVFIVSRMGAYLAHIYENPVFIMDDEEGFFETPDFHFQKWSFNALARGGSEFPGVEPIQALVGTDENPGPLHYSLEPRVFVVTPFEEGLKEGNLEYEDRAVWLTDQFRDFFYPHGCADQNQPLLAGYEQVGKQEAQKLDNPAGKAIVEATPIQFWMETGNQQLAVGRWRLWVGGTKFAQYDFWDPKSVSTRGTDGSATTSAADRAVSRARQLGGPQGVCPVSFSSTSTTPSTFITTTKSSTTESFTTTTTTTRTRPHGPAGQPPGFAPPTATVTRPHGPTGQPPGFTLPTAPHEPPTTTTADPNTPPQPIPATPLPPIFCYEEENVKPAPIDEVAVQHLADFCSRGLKGDELNLGPGSKPVKINAASPKGFPFYYVDISYVGSCSDGTAPRQNPQFPMVGYTCASIVTEIFKLTTCDTKNGYGGEIIMGCLKYAARSFGGGKET
ncbi:hypothetical protein BJX68DRAFT_273665 [Aspergillus pseudodeflectus]|uniref:Uncharacterized protein n=1 Tax=Aspergillus pseudodeflectus TaxID=176178 RepID=A0ABR4JAD1_9EURO